MYPNDFYLAPEELFRLGNTSSPKLSHVRAREINVTEINGIIVIIANGKGSTNPPWPAGYSVFRQTLDRQTA